MYPDKVVKGVMVVCAVLLATSAIYYVFGIALPEKRAAQEIRRKQAIDDCVEKLHGVYNPASMAYAEILLSPETTDATREQARIGLENATCSFERSKALCYSENGSTNIIDTFVSPKCADAK